MRRLALAITVTAAAASFATAALAQAPETGPENTLRYFITPLEKDPSRVVQMQMQTHLPHRPGNPFHTHPGDQWQVVIDGEISYQVKGQEPRLLKAGDSVYIPRGTIHRNENKSNAPTRTIELVIRDKDKPAVVRESN